MKISIKPAFIICILLLNTIALRAQSDFSGTWNLDHSKSAAEFRDYDVTVVITQTVGTITVEQTIIMKTGEKSVMPATTYNLDGKEVIKEEQGGKNRLSATWSADKKSLLIKFVRTMDDGKDYGSKTSYNLSTDGRVLTIKSTDLTGESPMIQTYNKKL